MSFHSTSEVDPETYHSDINDTDDEEEAGEIFFEAPVLLARYSHDMRSRHEPGNGSGGQSSYRVRSDTAISSATANTVNR